MLNDEPSKRLRLLLYILGILSFVLIGILIPRNSASSLTENVDYNAPYLSSRLIPPDAPLEVVTNDSGASQDVSVVFPQSDYWEILDNYDWDVNTAHAIMMCESHGGKPWIVNSRPPDYSIGLFQINLYGNLKYSRPSEAWLKVPSNNIDYAYMMYKASIARHGYGWQPWGCYTLNLYQKYL